MENYRDFACCGTLQRCLSGTILGLFFIAIAGLMVFWQNWNTVTKQELMGRDLRAHVTLFDAFGAKRTEFDARVSTAKRPYGWRVEEIVTFADGEVERNTWRIDRLTRSAVRRNLLLRVDRDGDAEARGVWSMITRAEKTRAGETFRARKSVYHSGVGHGTLEITFRPVKNRRVMTSR